MGGLKLALHEGPAFAPALSTSRAPAQPAARTAPRRRPIGRGARHGITTDPGGIAHRHVVLVRSPRKSMKRTTFLAAMLCAFVASAAALGIGAAVDTPRSLMSRADFQDARRGIETATRAALADCRSAGEAATREMCRARARGDERVKMAELQARYEGTVWSLKGIGIAKIRAEYELARAHCAALPSTGQVPCLRAAREAWTRQSREAKLASAT
ncbi:MAG TPA: hypothetical protein VFP44_23805 [Usitatibacter sp.]|nr:hypothetical protein [Usitatibacter sp.]